MITEETINQTKFFMGGDGKCYLVKNVRTVKLVTLICTRDGSESDLLLGDDICEQFAPAEASFEPFTQNQVAAADPPAVPDTKKVTRKYKKRKGAAVKTRKPKHVAGHRGPLKKVSQYKGVSLCKKRKNGTQKWRVQYYDRSDRRVKSLGAYETELEAAAVYQERDGNKAEAKRLRSLAKQQKADMAEQTENNPDREPRLPIPKLKTWICTHCKLPNRHTTKPLRCVGCDSTSFKEG